MSRALAVFHGRFGRATVYQLNRPFNMHAHREGHLIFHVGGTPARIDVCDERWLLAEDSIVAINPWEPHNFVPTDMDNGAIFFVLYVNAEWFAPERGARPQPAVRPHLLQAHSCARQAYSPHRRAGLRRAFAEQPRLRTQAIDRRLL